MKRKIVISIVGLMIVISVLIIVFWNQGDNEYLGEFNPITWAENPFDRWDMVESLRQQYDLSSMTRDEIIELLGENGAEISSNWIRYETGGGLLGDNILSFIFDENGNVVSYGIAN